MSKYSIWQSGPGALTLSVRALRPFVMTTRLSLIASGAVTHLSSTTVDGIDNYELDANQVQILRSAPTSANPPSLLFTCGAVRHPAAPDRSWGWGIRLARAGTVLLPVDDSGSPLPVDGDGFHLTSVRSFPAGKNIAAGMELITLR